jgi:hypothetical protein
VSCVYSTVRILSGTVAVAARRWGYCRARANCQLIGTVGPFALIFSHPSYYPILSTLRIPWTTQDGMPADGLHMRLVSLKPLRQFTSRVRIRIRSGRCPACNQRSRRPFSSRRAGRTDGWYLHRRLGSACAETSLSAPNSTTSHQRRRGCSDEHFYAFPPIEPTPPTNWLSIRSSSLRVSLACPSGWRAPVDGRESPRAAQPRRTFSDTQS